MGGGLVRGFLVGLCITTLAAFRLWVATMEVADNTSQALVPFLLDQVCPQSTCPPATTPLNQRSPLLRTLTSHTNRESPPGPSRRAN